MHQSFNQRVHFYYCVLVALKMHGKSKKSGGIRGKNNFLLKWLRRRRITTSSRPISPAKLNGCEVKSFRPVTTPISNPMLDFVYATASRAEALKNAE
ncbi:Uncharacterised protein [Klebsiella variicola]|uniref:Uncharacterized protein n=1 Tax=Klebsiella variicola TaxID=244366 RepID=A0A7H4MJX5_KLEVA|nr:Uncharacterised protein [Klebsiella variicola]